MRVAVAGSGALGSLYGGFLAGGGHDVLLLDSWQQHVEAINEQGLVIEGEDSPRVVRVPAAQELTSPDPIDLMLLFCKSYDTREWIDRASDAVGPETTLLTLQNGYGNAQALVERFGAERVLLGVSYQAARVLGPGRILHSASGVTVLGGFVPGRKPTAEKVAAALDEAGLEARYEVDVHEEVWTKLLVNVGVNAVAALTRMSCGALVADADAWSVIETLTTEAVEVARAEGVKLDRDSVVAHIRSTLEAAGWDSRPSTLQDIERARPTEIDALNAAVGRLGAKYGIDTAANDLVTKLTRALERQTLSSKDSA